VTTPSGSLYLVPNTLDLGVEGSLPSLDDTLAPGVIRIASRLEYWVVENAKTARSFLKRVDAIAPLARPLQELSIIELPRPSKGRQSAPTRDLNALLAPATRGRDVGLLSEAGLAAVADPGSALVQAAHAQRLNVVSLPGPSSLLLALAASGLNGQGFAFVGYLPIDATARAQRIRELEQQSRRDGHTQLMIETPYRNQALLDGLLNALQPSTRLCVSCGLTLAAGFTRTLTVTEWRAAKASLPSNIPAVFLLLAGTAA
jgi:16S rRNA (cytidine1402-2'-O)-methyltransferase